MTRAPRGKVVLVAYIDEKLYEEVRALALQSSEKLHGALSREVEEALRHWVALNKQTASRSARFKASKVEEAFEDVKRYLIEKYKYVVVRGVTEIPRAHLIEAIMATRGYDRRTVKTWIERFLNAKVLERVGPETFRVL